MDGLSILVVEDEGIVAMDIKMMLQHLGYSVAGIAFSGEDAINLVASEGPDLVLMDIGLRGDIDGVEAAGRIREQFQIPVIYLTAYGDALTLRRAKVTDPSGYLVKPLEEGALQNTIERALS